MFDLKRLLTIPAVTVNEARLENPSLRLQGQKKPRNNSLQREFTHHIKFGPLEDWICQAHHMPEVSTVKSAPRVFPGIYCLSDLGVTGGHVEAKLSSWRCRFPV